MTTTRFTFSKQEKLCSKKLTEQLFEKGKSFMAAPIRVVYMETEFESPFPAQILTVVSKRYFKSAVDRNRLKRLMREAYRLNKQPLYQHLNKVNKKLVFAIMITNNKMQPYSVIEDSIKKLIAQFEKKICE